MGNLVLTEVMKHYHLESQLQLGQINLIYSPCGSGKTYWSADYTSRMIDKNTTVLFITDSCLNVKSFTEKIKEVRYKDYKDEELKKEMKELETQFLAYGSYKINNANGGRVYINNYNHVAVKMTNQPKFLDEFDVIIADELSGIFWRKNCKSLIDAIPLLIQSKLFIAIDATPRLIFGHYRDLQINDILKPHRNELKRYRVADTTVVNNFKTFDFTQLKDKRFLFFTLRVKDQLYYQELMNKAGLKVKFICSDAHAEFTTEMKEIKEFIIKEHTIPHELDGLIINKSAFTGLDFSGIDCVLVNDPSKDTITQVIGRVRHNLDEAYHLPYDKTELYESLMDNLDTINDLIEAYSERKLFKPEQKEFLALMYNLGLTDKGKPIKTLKSFTKIYYQLIVTELSNEYIDFVEFYDLEIESGKHYERDEHYNQHYVIIHLV